MPVLRKLAVLVVLLMVAVPESPAQRGRRPKSERLVPATASGPDLGDPAPDLALYDTEGNPVQLADRWADGALVVVLGSYTSPEFRETVGDLERMGTVFGAHVGALALYTVEANPSQDEAAGGLAQAETLEERREAARLAGEKLTLGNLEILVDGMENAAQEAYGREPNAAYLIDRGYVVVRQAAFDPVEMDRVIREMLRLRPPAPAAETVPAETKPSDGGR